MIDLNKKFFLSLILFVIILFVLGVLFSKQNFDPKQRALKNKDCLHCHAETENTELLSQRASGKYGIIFYHNSHVKGKNMMCIDCHDENKYHQSRPLMEDCLICHDNKLASNDCSTCHMNEDKLDLER